MASECPVSPLGDQVIASLGVLSLWSQNRAQSLSQCTISLSSILSLEYIVQLPILGLSPYIKCPFSRILANIFTVFLLRRHLVDENKCIQRQKDFWSHHYVYLKKKANPKNHKELQLIIHKLPKGSVLPFEVMWASASVQECKVSLCKTSFHGLVSPRYCQ